MSEALYKLGGLRFWNEREIELRELFQIRTISTVKDTLLNINPAFRISRVEGPCLTPIEYVNTVYTDKDLFITNHEAFGKSLVLRPETTASSYLFARQFNKFPVCVYQIGKSFRRELNDGASANKLRFNEFWQLEFQCIYTNNTKADYRKTLIDNLVKEVRRFTERSVRVSSSERLPAYSESTEDIEVFIDEKESWCEVASCSIRTDFSKEHKVCEIAFGLDRIVAVATK